MAKDKDNFNYEDLADSLTSLDNADNIDDVMAYFGGIDIPNPEEMELVKTTKKFEEVKRQDSREPDTNFDPEAETRVTDPVKMYLREMGQVSLLTREGEVAIAQRIEMGEQFVITAILETSVGIEEICELRKKLEADEIRLKEVVKDSDEEEENFVETPQRQDQIIDLIKEIERKSQNYTRQIRKVAAEKKASDKAKQVKMQADLAKRKMG